MTGVLVGLALVVSGCGSTPPRPLTLPPVNPTTENPVRAVTSTPGTTSTTLGTTSTVPESSSSTTAPASSSENVEPLITTEVPLPNSDQPVPASADEQAGEAAPLSTETAAAQTSVAGVGAPRFTADPADYSSPESVVVQYLSVWCFQSVQGPANSNISNAAPWLSKAGWDSDLTMAMTDQQWAQYQAAGLSQYCDPATAVLAQHGPVDGLTRWVEARATMYQVDAGGVVVSSREVAQTRAAVQDSDGRWYVGVRVQAG